MERLTDMPGASAPNSQHHAASCSQASRSTRAPMGTIRPVSSAAGRNSVGSISSRPGRFHRARPSKLEIAPLLTSMTGW